MLVDALLQHEVEEQVNRIVEKVRRLEIKQEVVGIAKGVAEVVKEVVKVVRKVTRVVKEVVEGNVRIINMNNDRGGCSYKEFMACNPKEYDGKGGVIAYTRWIEKMESVLDMSGCGENQKELFLGEDATRAIPNMGFNLVNVEGKLTLSSLDVLQGFSFFFQMGFTLILATLDGLDVGLLGDVIGEDDCDDDG
ncbi:hypothetical protein Tco_1136016 [Tanacetum coccineum]